MNDKEFFKQLGVALCCEPAALKAVEEVESGGRGGFLPSGRAQILFEGHQFYKRLKESQSEVFAKQIAERFPNICYPKWDKSKYKGGEGEWERLIIARSVDPIVADMCASWGRFQIMGFNFSLCGCSSVVEMVKIMSESATEQFRLFANFLKSSGCLPSLQKKQWATFAKKYNGAGYAQNSYDIKLATAYSKFVKQGYNS